MKTGLKIGFREAIYFKEALCYLMEIIFLKLVNKVITMCNRYPGVIYMCTYVQIFWIVSHN
jgi:hypothetical protein